MKVYLTQGTAYTIKNGKRENVEFIEASTGECCKLDCCDNVLIMKDKDSGDTMVGYFFDGAWTVTTKAKFDTDKTNGEFSY